MKVLLAHVPVENLRPQTKSPFVATIETENIRQSTASRVSGHVTISLISGGTAVVNSSLTISQASKDRYFRKPESPLEMFRANTAPLFAGAQWRLFESELPPLARSILDDLLDSLSVFRMSSLHNQISHYLCCRKVIQVSVRPGLLLRFEGVLLFLVQCLITYVSKH